jgi:hypothetical protein
MIDIAKPANDTWQMNVEGLVMARRYLIYVDLGYVKHREYWKWVSPPQKEGDVGRGCGEFSQVLEGREIPTAKRGEKVRVFEIHRHAWSNFETSESRKTIEHVHEAIGFHLSVIKVELDKIGNSVHKFGRHYIPI